MSKLVTGLTISMGQATMLAALTGFGFRDIGVGGIITESGSTDITHRDKFLLRLNFGPDIRGNRRPNLRTGSTSHGRHVLFLEQIRFSCCVKILKLCPAAPRSITDCNFFSWTENKSNRRSSLIQDPLLITSCDQPDGELAESKKSQHYFRKRLT